MITPAHLGLLVNNCEKSRDFYCQYLQCTQEGSWQNQDFKAIELRCGSLVIELLQSLSAQSPKRSDGIYDHLAFQTENIAALIQTLKNLGAVFETTTPRELANGRKIIFFRGPDGERIELIQEP